MRGKERSVDFLKTCSIPSVRETDSLEYGPLKLYMPRAFKATTMMVGNPDSPVALCTGWGDPWDVVSQEEVEEFSIIAPLREPFGVDIMLYNLLANPQIRAVVFRLQGEFDRTKAAQRPIGILKAIGKNGVDDDGLVKGTSHRLFPELVEGGMIEKLREMIDDVQLIGLEGESTETVVAEMRKVEVFPSSRRIRVIPPEFHIPQVERFPSEEVSFQVRKSNAFEAWANFVGLIMRYGHDCPLEKGGALVRELPYTRIVLTGDPARFFAIPEWINEIRGAPLTSESLEAYYLNYIRPEKYREEIYPGVWKFIRPPEEKYLYAELIFAFPRPREVKMMIDSILEDQGIEAVYQHLESNFGIDEEKRAVVEALMRDRSVDDKKKAEVMLEIFVPPTNQLADKIRRIKEMPDDADKTVILWNPRTHGKQDRGRPCWIELSFLVREEKIHAKALFRSHDIAKGWLFNTYGIWRLWQDVCQETGYEMGKMTIESESAHVYKGDEPWVRSFCEKRLDRSRPRMAFAGEAADPRGNFIINIVDGEITCVLVSPDGRPLCKVKGRTAKRVMAEIDKLNLISQTSHALYLGAELTKAEVCSKLEVPYQQDKPLSRNELRGRQ